MRAGKEKRVEIRTHPEVALHLLDEERRMLGELRKEHGLELEIRDDPLLKLDEFRLFSLPGYRALDAQAVG